MREENLGQGAYILVPVSRTTFYTVVYPVLSNVHFWHAHYGDWALPQFKTRLIGCLKNIKEVRRVFGHKFVKPRAQADLSGYNTNPQEGRLAGYLLFLNPLHKGFQLSYNHEHQVLKFSFAYLTCRWCNVAEDPTGKCLTIMNGDNSTCGISTKQFPVQGHKVRIFWSSLGESYTAKVKRWSKTHRKWVLKYDGWKDSVVEDVPVVDWEFV